MTVLLVLGTLIVFLAIDYFYSKKREPQPAFVAAPVGTPRLVPDIVAGFRLPVNLRYHPGHTWALSESPNLVRVGLDDFAARLIGKPERVSLPRRGQWIRQGQRIWSVWRDGSEAAMVSPIEGMVTDINEGAVQNPGEAMKDPYGDGWLVLVHAPDARTNFRNLLCGGVARRWMEDAAARLFGQVPALAEGVAQDGGLVVDDIGGQLVEGKWTDVTKEFFLS